MMEKLIKSFSYCNFLKENNLSFDVSICIIQRQKMKRELVLCRLPFAILCGIILKFTLKNINTIQISETPPSNVFPVLQKLIAHLGMAHHAEY